MLVYVTFSVKDNSSVSITVVNLTKLELPTSQSVMTLVYMLSDPICTCCIYITLMPFTVQKYTVYSRMHTVTKQHTPHRNKYGNTRHRETFITIAFMAFRSGSYSSHEAEKHMETKAKHDGKCPSIVR